MGPKTHNRLEGAVEADDAPASSDIPVVEEHSDLIEEEQKQRLWIQKVLAPAVAVLVLVWLVFVMFVVVRAGTGVYKFHSSVLVTLLASATASIVGLMMQVVRYVFPERP